jgi:Cu-Zn family superoxide dismutase
MRRRTKAAVLALGLSTTIAAVVIAPAGGQAGGVMVRASLTDADGSSVGTVTFSQTSRTGTVTVGYRLRDLSPGFHGFHVHERGVCEAPTFQSAGGHVKPEDQTHPEHAGDLPVVLVNRDGTARGTIQTDRFTLRELKDDDGSAVMVHASPDNYANIPTDRYDPDPDATTLATGDAGARLACGPVR